MPEANVLYTVTAVVVAGLVVWVLASLKMAKQPWARPEAAAAIAASRVETREADVPVEKAEKKPAEEKPVPSDADVTAEATAVKKEESSADETKDDEKKAAPEA